MQDTAFNPHVSIRPGFPLMEVPALFCWQQAIRQSVCDDSSPKDIDEWMADRDFRSRRNIHTWAIYRDGIVGGCFEAELPAGGVVAGGQIGALKFIAECQILFRRDLFGFHITRTALNLCLQAIFTAETETAFFPVFQHNGRLKELYYTVGMQRIGLVEPRLQEGKEVATELLAITAREWQACNKHFLEAQTAASTARVEFSEQAEPTSAGAGR